ncbi:MAG TPA: isopentenyl-diphosphate Delta-isomerase [Bacteroidia bacterium]|nr:isopentenyl-diphosphate Delta-isomerase [Bacteroidia bacterium]
MVEQVILVDSRNRELGAMDKTEAHKAGKLHRALSVFVFNSKGELLMHRRAMGKYHSSGLWTNTCCSHPRPGENVAHAASRRLKEEMGMNTPLKELFDFIYKAELENGLYEHEADHVFIGTDNSDPVPDANEVMEWKWMLPDDILKDMDVNPNNYTIWFQLIFKDVIRRVREKA